MAMTNKTRLHRLWMLHEMLIHHKEIFPTVKFDLTDWAYNNKKTEDVACLLDGTCGSAGCAVGSACLHSEFNAMGLKLRHTDSGFNNGNHFEPVYKHRRGWEAVNAFFGITDVEAYTVFCSDSYPISPRQSPKYVAKRVKKLIEKYDA